MYSSLDKDYTSKSFDFFSKKSHQKITLKKPSNDFNVIINSDWGIINTTNFENAMVYIDMFTSDYNKRWKLDLKISEKIHEHSIIIKQVENSSKYTSEYHEILIKQTNIVISVVSGIGILRALMYLQDLSMLAGGPYYKVNEYKREVQFETRYIYSYCGLYGNVFDVESEKSYPDELLEEYARLGINGIWTQAVLYTLTPFSFMPNLSDGWEKRINNLKILSKRAKKYGIKVYLYINEPRAMPIAFFEKYPEIKGHASNKFACMCTSTAEVQKYLDDAIGIVCREVPDLGGFFTIVRSENMTNCYSHTNSVTNTCPRCKHRSISDVTAEVNKIIIDSVRKINPNTKVFAMLWGFEHIDKKEISGFIKELPKEVIVSTVSETNLEFEIDGKKNHVIDYTMSLIPPSDYSKNIWKESLEYGHETCAKVQINNTWECSTVPYIPVFNSVIKHMKNLIDENVSHLMLSWTLGGYPSPNLKIAACGFFKDENQKDDCYENAFELVFGNDCENIKESVQLFCNAFNEFPFDLKTLYLGPQNAGMSNLLYDKPTLLEATMTCYPYDDLKNWCLFYGVEIFENQFRLLSEKWKKGLDILNKLGDCELKDVSNVVYDIFKSSYNQICYIRARDKYLETNDDNVKKIIVSILKDEIDLAINAYSVMIKNSTIGYEAANHYFYNKSMLCEKIVNCNYLLSNVYN